MIKIIVSEFITLDGVIQAPGGPEEDPSENFEFGGWSAPQYEAVADKFMEKQLEPADLLLGRKTFDIFEAYWPQHASFWPGINEVTKYVLSGTRSRSDWKNFVFLENLSAIQHLKKSEGSDLVVWGSSKLVQLLLEHDLVDELWLKTHPLILGKGKKIFAAGAMPAAFELTSSAVTPKGVIFANYRWVGKVQTGTMEP